MKCVECNAGPIPVGYGQVVPELFPVVGMLLPDLPLYILKIEH